MFPIQAQLGGPGRFVPTRGRIQGGAMNGLSYPSPFFDVAQTYLPASFKQMFRYCRYYFLTNPVINAIVFKLAEYPITDILVEHDNPNVASRWTEYLQDHIGIRTLQLELGLDYFVYGNAFASLVNPFLKYLRCSSCSHQCVAKQHKALWTYTGQEFRLTCPRCMRTNTAIAVDRPLRQENGLRVLRWNPEDIDIEHHALTGETKYTYTIPQGLRSDILYGKKDVIAVTPQLFIEAVRKQQAVKLSPERVFHMRRSSIAGPEQGWGIPLMLPLLKDAFLLQIMKKHQETILTEHIVPLRTLFPQAASGTSDPFANISLVNWQEQISMEIARWRIDPNYMPILPLPIGTQTLGGDGKMLLVGNEMNMVIDQIIWGAGCPREFVTGGLSYSGSQTSMRMLENAFLGFILHHKKFTRWLIQSIADYLDWTPVKARYKPFKMADDLQRSAFFFQLSQSGKISDKTLLAQVDLDVHAENSLMERETDARVAATKKQQLAQANIQAEVQAVMMRAQSKVQAEIAQEQAAQQPAPGAPGGPEPALDPAQAAAAHAPPDTTVDPSAPQGPAAAATAVGAPPPATPRQSFDQQISSNLRADRRLNGQVGLDVRAYAQMLARHISTLPPDQAQIALQQVPPNIMSLVREALQDMQLTAQAGGGGGVDTRPLPAQRPPRRAQSPV